MFQGDSRQGGIATGWDCCVNSRSDAPTPRERCLKLGDDDVFETLFSVILLAGFIWVMRFLLPKGIKEHDWLALLSALLTPALTLIAWLMFGVGLRSR